MTLANMRANGARSLSVFCPACRRSVRFSVDGYPDDVPVLPSPRAWCALAAE
jgi:hypothetical protein